MSGSFTDAESAETERLLREFDSCFVKHDPAPLDRLIADSCVIENTRPAPHGARYEGKQACIALWTEIATNKDIRFETENIIARGDRGEITWRLVWGDEPQKSVRGVNLMRVQDGKIIEARGYVKGA